MREIELLPNLIFLYVAATILWLILSKVKKKWFDIFVFIFTAGTFIYHSYLLLLRIQSAHHAPFSNLFESMLFYSWCIIFILLVFYKKHQRFPITGAGICLFSTFLLFATTWVPLKSKLPTPLFPALQSKWFETHVIVAFIAYALFAIAAFHSIHYLIIRDSPFRKKIDKFVFLFVRIGYFLFSFGIISGAFWAYKAWGTYWSWDPKETWALITWGIYTYYLHIRPYSRKWASIVVIIGFLSVLFTYMGVSLILPGLHSYK